jgi:thiosulfate dehydrogenase (quinone)
MTAVNLGRKTHAVGSANTRAGSDLWRSVILALLCMRFIPRFISWGRGSGRFIYARSKLNPRAASWMANSLQSGMLGASPGTGHLIAVLPHHLNLLYLALILFGAGALIAGLFLVARFLTPAGTLAAIGFSIALMLLLGWQGTTRFDEWTLAASNLALGVTLILAGNMAER